MNLRALSHRARTLWRRVILTLTIAQALVACIGAGAFIWKYYEVSPSIALHYNVLMGTDSVGPWWYLLPLPIVAVLASALAVVAHRRFAGAALADTVLIGAWSTSLLLLLGLLFTFVASAT
jgi:phosphoglycerol transferase MdoB-like AlkP superfamily enzyme